MRRYRSEAGERWAAHHPRDGDIVVSTRSKCGTTWVQTMCLLLVHGHPLPAPVSELSPWLDWEVEPVEDVVARLDAQPGRRVIKTHTPLDGIPLHPGSDHVVVGRHPLDVAVSLFHHAHNLDRARFEELTGRPSAAPPPDDPHAWVETWLAPGVPPEVQLDTLPGLVHHLADAWARRPAGNVHLVHHRDLVDDREGSLRALAEELRFDVPDDRWPALVDATSFDVMRSSAPQHVPDRLGVLVDPQRFFRSGRSGDGLRTFGPDVLDRCTAVVEGSAPPDLAAWLLR